MAKHKSLNYYGYMVLDHIKQSTVGYILFALSLLIGLVTGIVLLCSQKSYLGLLTSTNQTLIKYMSGSAEVMHLFYSRILSGLFGILILFICSLSYYTIFLAYAYIGYQGMLCTLTLGTIINLNGFSGILNVLILLLPANLLLFASFALILSVLSKRARVQLKYKFSFSDSFKQDNFWQLLTIFLLVFVSVNLVLGLIIPLVIKGIFIIIY